MKGGVPERRQTIKDRVRQALAQFGRTERVKKSGAEWACFDKVRRRLAAGKLSLADKAVIGVGMLFHPNAVKRAVSYARSSGASGERRRYAVVAFSDGHGHIGEQMQWGDFWIKQALIEAITALGGSVVEPFMRPDVMIHLFGGYYDLPPAGEHVLWIHSHPEKINPAFLASYDRVYCISRRECDTLGATGIRCVWLPMATGKKRVHPVGEVEDRVVFVGNALPHLGGHRRVVDDMLEVCAKRPDVTFALWGGLYQDLPPGVLAGTYKPYHELDDLYARSAIVLNDHRPEMRERGFINPRILDVIASGGFVVSDRSEVVDELFEGAVPQYTSPEELGRILDAYLGHPESREVRMRGARSIVSAYTWERVARGLMGLS